MQILTYSELLTIVGDLVEATDAAFDDIEQTGSIRPQNASALRLHRAAALNAIAVEQAANGQASVKRREASNRVGDGQAVEVQPRQSTTK